MRTTINIDPHLLTEAKTIAAQSGKTLAAVIEDAIRESFLRRNAHVVQRPVRITTFGGGGVLPGVDISNNAALLDLMEEERDSERRQRVGVRASRRRR